MRQRMRWAAIGAAVVLAGCAHNRQYMEAAGDVAVDPAVAASTTVLRVTNNRDAEMKVFTTYDGREHYLGSVLAHRTRDFALDRALLGRTDVSFTSRGIDNSDAVIRGPYPLARGAVIAFAVPKRDLDKTEKSVRILPPGQ